jgi:hypothetical protein
MEETETGRTTEIDEEEEIFAEKLQEGYPSMG